MAWWVSCSLSGGRHASRAAEFKRMPRYLRQVVRPSLFCKWHAKGDTKGCEGFGPFLRDSTQRGDCKIGEGRGRKGFGSVASLAFAER